MRVLVWPFAAVVSLQEQVPEFRLASLYALSILVHRQILATCSRSIVVVCNCSRMCMRVYLGSPLVNLATVWLLFFHFEGCFYRCRFRWLLSVWYCRFWLHFIRFRKEGYWWGSSLIWVGPFSLSLSLPFSFPKIRRSELIEMHAPNTITMRWENDLTTFYALADW